MVFYLKQEAYSGPISFEIHCVEMTSELITFNQMRCHSCSSGLGTITESQFGEVQMKPPIIRDE